jgi:hypothetical protein
VKTLVSKFAFKWVNLCRYAAAKREVMAILPVMQTFMAMTKSKDADMQTSAATFLSNMTDTTDEAHRATLVQVGAVWRLKVGGLDKC